MSLQNPIHEQGELGAPLSLDPLRSSASAVKIRVHYILTSLITPSNICIGRLEGLQKSLEGLVQMDLVFLSCA